ncbi:hypothetical protein [Paenibacillus kobensis]|uniref:hypothetical protein n=1 Tax=Paenibacillus kobensis TaxID=59841 RepID=UPI000FD79FCF|nr:hypothetical protein [Paenibacillus kobensis]
MTRKKYFTLTIFAALVLLGVTVYGKGGLAHEGHESDDTHSEEYHSNFTNRATLTSNRDKITVCIEDYTQSTSNKALSEELKLKTNNIINEKVKKHIKWKNSGYSKEQIDIVEGCSFAPFLLDNGTAHPVYSGDMNKKLDRVISTASKEQLGIFIVDQSVVDKHFKNAPDRWSPEEMLCEHNECVEVTSGIYLTPDEVSGNEVNYLEKEILKRFGFEQGQLTSAQHDQIKKDELQKKAFLSKEG